MGGEGAGRVPAPDRSGRGRGTIVTEHRYTGFALVLGAALAWLVPAAPVLAEDDPSDTAVEDAPDAGLPGAVQQDALRPDKAPPKQEELRRERQYWWQENRQQPWKEQRQHWWQHPRETGR